jgi:hypothetical protein
VFEQPGLLGFGAPFLDTSAATTTGCSPVATPHVRDKVAAGANVPIRLLDHPHRARHPRAIPFFPVDLSTKGSATGYWIASAPDPPELVFSGSTRAQTWCGARAVQLLPLALGILRRPPLLLDILRCQ